MYSGLVKLSEDSRMNNRASNGLNKKASLSTALVAPAATMSASGYMGKRDAEKGENNIGKHTAGHAALAGGLGTAGGVMLGGVKTGAKLGLYGAALGAAGGAASYGLGRLFGKEKKRAK